MPAADATAARAALDATVAEARAALDFPPPERTGVCIGCCMDPGIEAAFLGVPARDLPSAWVRDWYFAATADDIGLAEMGWILPRILRGLAEEGEDITFFGLETALVRLPQAGLPDGWPAPAVATVERFADAWLDRVAAEVRPDLEESLAMIANGGMALAPRRARLEALPDAVLARLLHANWAGRVWSTPGWTRTADRAATLAWYLSPALEDRMVVAGLAGDDRAAEVSDIISRARRAST